MDAKIWSERIFEEKGLGDFLQYIVFYWAKAYIYIFTDTVYPILSTEDYCRAQIDFIYVLYRAE
jgi:hypothetical protein